jgi:arabinofuranan 3-O-arabinosyltransferase
MLGTGRAARPRDLRLQEASGYNPAVPSQVTRGSDAPSFDSNGLAKSKDEAPRPVPAASPSVQERPTASTTLAPAETRLGTLGTFWAGITGRASPKTVKVVTILLWVAAAVSWVVLFHIMVREKNLGWDLRTVWRAEVAFAHGGKPYAVKAFVYPPSCLLLMRPLAWLNMHQLDVGGEVVTSLIAIGSVMVSAKAVGVRWFGPTTAATVLLLSLTGAMRGEMPLENVSVLEFLALALFFLFALRGRWYAAAIVIGLSLSIKPLLIVVLIVFLLAKKWKELGVAVGVAVVLNGIALALVTGPGQVLSKLPSLLNRSGSGVGYNSAWVDVARTLDLSDFETIVLRVLTVGLVLLLTWLAWTRLNDPRLRIIVSSSVLLIGVFLAGTLSEYHFMLTLVPLCMTVVIISSPMRTIPAWIAMAWVMDVLDPPRTWLGLKGSNINESLFRAIGMSLLLVCFLVSIAAIRFRNAQSRAIGGESAT